MGFFDRFKQSNINQGIEEYKRTDDAVLLDVRTPQEYQEGHIPESKNVPLQQLNNVVAMAHFYFLVYALPDIPAAYEHPAELHQQSFYIPLSLD